MPKQLTSLYQPYQIRQSSNP